MIENGNQNTESNDARVNANEYTSKYIQSLEPHESKSLLDVKQMADKDYQKMMDSLIQKNDALELTIKDLTLAYTNIQRDILKEANTLKVKLIAAEDTIAMEKRKRSDLENMLINCSRSIQHLESIVDRRINTNEKDLKLIKRTIEKCKNVPENFKDKSDTVSGTLPSIVFTDYNIKKDKYDAVGNIPDSEYANDKYITPVSFEECIDECRNRNLCTSGISQQVELLHEEMKDTREEINAHRPKLAHFQTLIRNFTFYFSTIA